MEGKGDKCREREKERRRMDGWCKDNKLDEVENYRLETCTEHERNVISGVKTER